MFPIKAFTLVVVLMLLWRDNIVDSFPLCCTIETLSAGLLNNFKKQEVCVINIWGGCERSTSACSCWCSMGSDRKKFKKTYVSFSTTDWGLNQQCMENLLQ